MIECCPTQLAPDSATLRFRLGEGRVQKSLPAVLRVINPGQFKKIDSWFISITKVFLLPKHAGPSQCNYS
jgi:hypothetical protein